MMVQKLALRKIPHKITYNKKQSCHFLELPTVAHAFGEYTEWIGIFGIGAQSERRKIGRLTKLAP